MITEYERKAAARATVKRWIEQYAEISDFWNRVSRDTTPKEGKKMKHPRTGEELIKVDPRSLKKGDKFFAHYLPWITDDIYEVEQSFDRIEHSMVFGRNNVTGAIWQWLLNRCDFYVRAPKKRGFSGFKVGDLFTVSNCADSEIQRNEYDGRVFEVTADLGSPSADFIAGRVFAGPPLPGGKSFTGIHCDARVVTKLERQPKPLTEAQKAKKVEGWKSHIEGLKVGLKRAEVAEAAAYEAYVAADEAFLKAIDKVLSIREEIANLEARITEFD